MIIYPKKYKKIILIGWDYDLINELRSNNIFIHGYTSDKKKTDTYKYLGSIKNIKSIDKKIGMLIPDSDIELKSYVFKKFKSQVCTFKSRYSIIPNLKKIGIGSIIQSNVFVSENSLIGKCVKINVGSQIHHDTIIGDFSILGPRVTILGNSIIGQKTFIGAGAIIKNKIKIAEKSFIGMGSVVVNDTKKGTYFGNPAKKVRKKIIFKN